MQVTVQMVLHGQSLVPPHPSEVEPQSLSVQATGVQSVVVVVMLVVVTVVVVVMQVSPSHNSGAQAGKHSPKPVGVGSTQVWHAPQVQLSVPPQPSDPVPQSNERHVRGVQHCPLKTTCLGPQQRPNSGLALPG